MPKLNPAEKKRRAKIIAKKLIKADGSVNALARIEGVSPQTISKKVNTPEVQSELHRLFEQVGATDLHFVTRVKEGMDAIKLQSINFEIHKVPDHKARHRFCDMFAKVKGILKEATAGPSGMIIMIPGGYDNIL